jgi:hypothetical protein
VSQPGELNPQATKNIPLSANSGEREIFGAEQEFFKKIPAEYCIVNFFIYFAPQRTTKYNDESVRPAP